MSADENLSAFSFLKPQSTADSSSTTTSLTFFSNGVDEIKLQKSAQFKLVKKKKKFTRIGSGRDSVIDDESDTSEVKNESKSTDINLPVPNVDDSETSDVHPSSANSSSCKSDFLGNDYERSIDIESYRLENGAVISCDSPNDVPTDFSPNQSLVEENSRDYFSFKSEGRMCVNHAKLCKVNDDEKVFPEHHEHVSDEDSAVVYLNRETPAVCKENSSMGKYNDEVTIEVSIEKEKESTELHRVLSSELINDSSNDSEANEKAGTVDFKENTVRINASITNEDEEGVKENGESPITPMNDTESIQNTTMTHKLIQDQCIKEVLAFVETIKILSTKHQKNIQYIQRLNSDLVESQESIVAMQRRIVEVEIQQDELAIREEFEKADAFTWEVELTRQNIDIIKDNIVKFSEEKIIVSKDIHGYHNNCSKCVAAVLDSLNKLKSQHETTLKQLEKEENKETRRFEEEDKRIRLEKSYVDHEYEVLNEESKSIENSINDQCGEKLMSVQQLTQVLDIVRNDILELERQLLLKREQEGKLVYDLEELKTDINKVRKQHDRSLNRIKDRLAAVSKATSDIEMESTALKQERERCMDKFGILVNSQVWTSFYDSSLIVLEPFQQCLQDASSFQPDIIDNDMILEKLKKEVSRYNILLEQSIMKEKSIQQNIRQLEQKTLMKNERIAKLEEEKFIYASSKKFKEAASTLSEIKFCQKEIMVINDEKTVLLLLLSSASDDVVKYRVDAEKSVIEFTDCSNKSQSKHVHQRSKFQHQRRAHLDCLKSALEKHNSSLLSFNFGDHMLEVIQTVLGMDDSRFNNKDAEDDTFDNLSESIIILSNKLETLISEERYDEAANVNEEIEQMKLKLNL